MFPDSLCWFAGTGFIRYRFEGNDVEAVLQRLERLVTEERTDSLVAVVQVMLHFIGSISLSHKGDMNAV